MVRAVNRNLRRVSFLAGTGDTGKVYVTGKGDAIVTYTSHASIGRVEPQTDPDFWCSDEMWRRIERACTPRRWELSPAWIR